MKLHYFLYLLLLWSIPVWGQAGVPPSVDVRLTTDGCNYAPATFEATVHNLERYVCQWWKMGEVRDIPLGEGLIYEIGHLSSQDAGIYYCVVTDPVSGAFVTSGYVTLQVAMLDVHLPSVLNVSEREKFTVVATDALEAVIDPGKLKWYENGIANKSGNTFTAKAQNSQIRVEYREGSCLGKDSTEVIVKLRKVFRGGNEDGFARVSLSFQVEITIPREFCENEELAFKASAKGDAGTAGFTYRWWKVGHGYDKLVSERQNFYLSPSVVTDAGDYYCEVRDMNGFTVLSDTQTLTLRPVKIHVTPPLYYVTQGEGIRLAALHAGGDTIRNDSLQWFKRENTGITALNPGLAPNTLSFIAGGNDMFIKAVYTNEKGCRAQDSSRIITRSDKRFIGGVDDGFAFSGAGFSVIRLMPVEKLYEFCDGGSILFRAAVPGSDNDQYRFRWWKVSSPTNELLSESVVFELNSLQARDAGFYFCEARDLNGFSAVTDTVQLTVKRVVLPPALFATAGEHLSILANDIQGHPVQATLTWRPSGVGNGNPLNLIAPANDMLVRVACDFGGGCKANDSTWIYIRDKISFAGAEEDGFARTLTPPVIVKPWLPQQLCTLEDTVMLKVAAIGSDLRYQWQMSLDGLHFKMVEMGTVNDEPILRLKNMPVDFNASFRCMVWNKLGIVYSDTLQLYGHHNLKAVVDKDFVMVYDKKEEMVHVSLEAGITPWTYHYATPLGTRYQRKELVERTDNMKVSEVGTYRFIYLRDAAGCERYDSLPEIEVARPEIPKITISGDKEVCQGSDVMLRLEVSNGVGPWEVWVDLNGAPAVEPGIDWPLTLYSRDTSLFFQAGMAGIYTVSKIQDLNGGNGRPVTAGVTAGQAVISLHDPDIVRFAVLADNHLGSCHDVRLFDVLQPQADGVREQPADGAFYINGVRCETVWHPYAGEHVVKYMQHPDQYGCVGETQVNLVVDASPVAGLFVPSFVCEDDTAGMRVETYGNGIRFGLDQKRVSRSAGTVVYSRNLDMPSFASVYREAVRFIDGDSCLIYTIRDITDKYGCNSENTAILSDTVYQRFIPELRLNSRYPDTDQIAWNITSDTIWTYGDGVGLQAGLERGVNPFRLFMDDSEVVDMTAFQLTDEKSYHFKIADKYCTNKNAGSLTICYLRPLCIRLKVMLENQTGQYDHLLVSLQDTSGTVYAVDTCSVLIDGTVIGRDGGAVLSFTDKGLHRDNAYRIVIGGKDYLSVQSKRSYVLGTTPGFAMLVDFTDANTVYTVGGDLSRHMTKLAERDGKSIWGLSAVEANVDALISVKDANMMKINGMEGGRMGMTRQNRDKYSETK